MGVQRRSESYSDSLAVLVVDEDPASGLVIETRLERFEARVQTAESGRQALQLFEVNRRQIVVTGVRVPDLDGGVLVANLRMLDEKVVVIDAAAVTEKERLICAYARGGPPPPRGSGASRLLDCWACGNGRAVGGYRKMGDGAVVAATIP